MDLELREEIYQKALKKWKERSQLEMAQEEAIEFALAIRKFIRKADDQTFSNLLEEIADVEIMIEQIKMMYRHTGIESSIEIEKIFKVNRLKDRLNNDSYNG